MRVFRVAAVVVLLVLGSSACGSDEKSSSDTTAGGDNTTTTAGASGNSIVIENTAFSPAQLEISAGSTVTISNKDAGSHTWTADDDDGGFDEALGGGDSTTHVFADAGTYPYHCEIHSSMKGTVVVE
jgi:plastocyanin